MCVDYALWSTFRPEDIDIDQELEMECLDGGMVLSKTLVTASLIGARSRFCASLS